MRKFVIDWLLLIGSLLVCLVGAEVVTRLIDGLPVAALMLPPNNNLGRNTTSSHLDEIPRAVGVKREWFPHDVPPLPNRRPVPAEWLATAPGHRDADLVPDGRFKSWDWYKAWNSTLVDDLCKTGFLGSGVERLFVFDPPDGEKLPPFRYLPDATTPMGLVTNEFGWRGPPVHFAREAKTVRIVFVGASTTAGPHGFPYALPELVGYWLDLWAAERWPGIRIEVLNAARESLTSTTIEAVVRQEVAATRPDLVVYYEGGNQFQLASLVRNLPEKVTPPQAETPQGFSAWLLTASRYSALARRLQALTGFQGLSEGGRELPKPDYELHWPEGLDELDPALDYPDLPVNLGTILSDLDRMRADLAKVDSELALSSFLWMAKDGMVINPIRNKLLWESLNIHHYPYRYRDIERLAAFQNRVLAKYAAAHDLPFIDVAGSMPFDPDLFADAVHETFSGMRLRAWVVLQQLVPMIDKRLASGAWPKPMPAMDDVHPAFKKKPRQITVDCTRSRSATQQRSVSP